MRFIADLHIHSYLSRATSKNLNLEQLYRWAQLKGISLVGTGDFTRIATSEPCPFLGALPTDLVHEVRLREPRRPPRQLSLL